MVVLPGQCWLWKLEASMAEEADFVSVWKVQPQWYYWKCSKHDWKQIQKACSPIGLRQQLGLELVHWPIKIFSKAILEKRAIGALDGLSHIPDLLGSYLYLERRPKRAQDLQATLVEWDTLHMHIGDWRGSGGKTCKLPRFWKYSPIWYKYPQLQCGRFTGFRFEQTLSPITGCLVSYADRSITIRNWGQNEKKKKWG